MVNEAIAAIKPEHSSGPFDIVEHDQDVKLNQRRTYMIWISCMAVQVVWIGCVCRRRHQCLNMRVVFRDCSWKWQILRTGISMHCHGVVGNEQ